MKNFISAAFPRMTALVSNYRPRQRRLAFSRPFLFNLVEGKDQVGTFTSVIGQSESFLMDVTKVIEAGEIRWERVELLTIKMDWQLWRDLDADLISIDSMGLRVACVQQTSQDERRERNPPATILTEEDAILRKKAIVRRSFLHWDEVKWS